MKTLFLAVILSLFLVGPVAAQGFAVDGLSVSPLQTTFGRVQLGACDTETLAGCKFKTFTFTNTGQSTLVFDSFRYSSKPAPFDDVAFGVGRNTCADTWSLVAGASCTVRLTMTPMILGKVKGSVELWSGTERLAFIPIKATGIR